MTMLSLVSLQTILRAKNEFWPSLAYSRPYDPVVELKVLRRRCSQQSSAGPDSLVQPQSCYYLWMPLSPFSRLGNDEHIYFS